MKRFLCSSLLLCIVILLDRISKCWALSALSDTSWSIIYGFNMVLSWNRGISWGMFSHQSATGFIALTALICLVITLFFVYTVNCFRQGHAIVGEVMVLGGALSNIMDRLWYGAVIDFIQLYIAHYFFPVFNIADTFIVLGVSYILFNSWWCRDEQYM